MRVLSLNWNYGMCSARYQYRKIAATRLARSRSGTVIPIQRQHAQKNCYILIIETDMRLASQEEETRLSRRQSRDRARRAAQSSQATKNCRGSETAEARERTARDRRKAARFRKR